jgi:hypothetical protein
MIRGAGMDVVDAMVSQPRGQRVVRRRCRLVSSNAGQPVSSRSPHDTGIAFLPAPRELLRSATAARRRRVRALAEHLGVAIMRRGV